MSLFAAPTQSSRIGHHARVRLSRADRSAYLLAGLLTSTGLLHFVVPGPFRSIIPKNLPAKNALVAGSGVVELVCAGLVAAPRTRQVGGGLTAATFVAVFPANVSMALRSGRRPLWYRAVAWLRLPGQVPLIVWALRVARTAGSQPAG